MSKDGVVVATDFLFMDDIRTITNPDSSFFEKAVAGASLLPQGKILKAGKVVKLGDDVVDAGKSTSKAVNLPSYKKVDIDMKHIMSGHSSSGGRALQSGAKDLFPSNMSQKQIENAIRNAYQHGKKIQTQGDRVKVQGESGGLTIEMWVNTKTKIIETAYPKY